VTARADDDSILDEDVLLRRVPNRPRFLASDGKGGRRLSSQALELRESEEGCSVDVQSRLVDPANRESVLNGHPSAWGLACFLAQDARACQHNVAGDPLPDNQAHALVVPLAESRTAQKRNFSDLAKRASLLKEPEMNNDTAQR
jgi:hypothetical protein